MKVWIIEQGEYSDYRVVGIFSTKENAEQVAAKINEGRDAYDSTTVVERELDPAVDALNEGMSRWYVLMLYNGDVEQCRQREGLYDLENEHFLWRRSKAPAYTGKNIPDCLMATVWAMDKNHAIKIVNERRAQMIANGKWE